MSGSRFGGIPFFYFSVALVLICAQGAQAQFATVEVSDWDQMRTHYENQSPPVSTLYQFVPSGPPNGDGKIELRVPASEDVFLTFNHDAEIQINIRIPHNTLIVPEVGSDFGFAIIESGFVSIEGPELPEGEPELFPEFTGFSAENRGGGFIQITDGFGSTSLSHLHIRGNWSTESGGAISQSGGTLTLNHVVLAENMAQGHGGAVFSTESSTFSASNSSFTGNSSGANGGAVYTNALTTSLLQNFFSGNHSADRGGNVEYSGNGNFFFKRNVVVEGVGDVRGDGFNASPSSVGIYQALSNIFFGTADCNPMSATHRPGSDFSFNWVDNNGGPYFGGIFEGSGGMSFANIFSSRQSSLPARFGNGITDSRFNAELANQASTQLSGFDYLLGPFTDTLPVNLETTREELLQSLRDEVLGDWSNSDQIRDRVPVFIWEGPDPEHQSPESVSSHLKSTTEDITDNCPLIDLSGLARPQDGDGDGTPACDTGPFEAQNGPDIGPGQSGAFFDINRDGEGMFVQMLGGGRAVVYLFSYTPEGEQMWLVGVGEVYGNSLYFEEMLLPGGPAFGPGYDPGLLVFTDWGAMSVHWPSCAATATGPGVMTFESVDAAYGKARMFSTRLSQPVACPGGVQHENAGWSGNYYLPEENGHGIVVEILPNGAVVMIWYLFDGDGNPAWVLGVGQLNGNVAEISDIRMPTGAKWGGDFDPADVVQNEWGRATLTFSCGSVAVDYDGIQGARSLDMTQLISLDGTSCP